MKSVAVVGAGILGLAHAYAHAKRGARVRVYERSPQATGASIRNFGMIWPIGQPSGPLAEVAMLSRRLWLELLDMARIPYWPAGSLHLAYQADEEAVAREFAEREPHRARWIGRDEALSRSHAANPEGLRGALFSEAEIIVDPRLAVPQLASLLKERFGVRFSFGTAVTDVGQLEADRVVICTGDDFETLYPRVFQSSGITRVKLQMLRTVPQPQGWSLGPAIAGGLTLQFYKSFQACTSLPELKARIAREMPEYNRWDIHVMASQTADGAITIGDSHEYGLSVDIFNKEEIDQLILTYLNRFARFPLPAIAQRWYGVYSKHPEKPFFVAEPEPEVRIVTAVGGAGMTLSFGLAEMLHTHSTSLM